MKMLRNEEAGEYCSDGRWWMRRRIMSRLPGLQRDTNGPTHSTTVLGFIQQLEDMQSAWKRYYTREAAPAKKQWQPTVQPTRMTPETACSLRSPKNEPPNRGMPPRDSSMSSLKFIHYDYQAQQAKKLRKRNGASRRPTETNTGKQTLGKRAFKHRALAARSHNHRPQAEISILHYKP